MSLLNRLLSRTYRAGLAAETAGDLDAAAKSYAKAGSKADLARVRRMMAGLAAEPKVAESHLRAALALFEATGKHGLPQTEEVKRELARLLLREPCDPAAAEEAAELFASAEDHRGAAEAFLRLGRRSEARDALAAGRHFEMLEELDRSIAEEQSSRSLREALLTRARQALAEGRRIEALAVATEAIAVAPDEARGLEKEISSRRLPGRMSMGLDGSKRRLSCIADTSLLLGRSEKSVLSLHDPGISRHHARIEWRDDSAWILEDIESRNGVFVSGIPIAKNFPLQGGEGRFSLGEHCAIAWRQVGDQSLLLTVERGLSAGARMLVMNDEVMLEDLFPGSLGPAVNHESGSSNEPPIPGPRLYLSSGWFVVEAEAVSIGGRELGRGAAVALLDGDRLSLDGVAMEFTRDD